MTIAYSDFNPTEKDAGPVQWTEVDLSHVGITGPATDIWQEDGVLYIAGGNPPVVAKSKDWGKTWKRVRNRRRKLR